VSAPAAGGVAFDIQGLQSILHQDRGISRYLRELAAALEHLHPKVVSRYVLNPDRAAPGAIEPVLAGGRLTFTDRLGRTDAAAYHIGSPFELDVPIDRIWPPVARQAPMRLLVTLYDLIPEVHPELYLKRAENRVRYRTRLGLIRSAERVLTISKATAADAHDRLGIDDRRLTVVGAGVSDRFHPGDGEAAYAELRANYPWLERDFIFYTGGIDPRKNVEGLLAAYAGLQPAQQASHQLVIVCRVTLPDRERLERELEALGIAASVRLPGYVPDDDLVRFYQAAGLFVFPSLYEGFGLPVAEAFACRAPVIAAGTSSVPELVRDERALFDPYDVRSIRDALARTIENGELREELRRPSGQVLRWSEVADRTAEAYEHVLAQPQRRRPRRRRLAFVTPLPPQASGVAAYSFRLLAELIEYCDIDCYVDDDAGRVEAPPRVRVERLNRLDRLDRAVGGYDTIVYCLGNSEFHARTLGVLRRRPGTVLAHDVRLTDLYALCAHRHPEVEPRDFATALGQMYGSRLPPGLGARGHLEFWESDQYGVLMAREAIHASELFLTHSDFGAQLARIDASQQDERKVHSLPFGFPDPGEFLERQVRGPLVATIGLATRVKQVDKLLEAFAEIAALNSEVRLAIVGPVISRDEHFRYVSLARSLGIVDRLDITGELDRVAFASWISRTSVAVQLRSWSYGESSAAVSECLAAGVPTIVTGLGAARELPDDCVVKVDQDIEPGALASEIARLLASPEKQQRLSEASQAQAHQHSFAHAARALYKLAVLGELPTTSRRAA
jgi:glycosyltransferase involved in cell wall biosynthesis